ncbi:MAG TPA: single-stranded DNA-binding protein [Anaerolineae bacterium]|nr:single-stranded DNA-binding protein [Caldilineae bacterium]HID33744.1 single-stranded DNA-binding protein [Anaerolineae bacterium]HIQ12591.1 single-stranded DNA-binding protein [Caldilineales bacterium]
MYQHVVIVGNLGRDPEMRYTPSGIPVTSFSVAVSRKWKNQEGELQEKTTWFRVTAWRKLAELCNQYLEKGRLVLVEGEIDASAWVGQDGEPRATLELTAQNVRFLGNRSSAGEFGGETAAFKEGPGPSEDDLPF